MLSSRLSLALVAAAVVLTAPVPAVADLPVPCVAGTCGGAVPGFVSNGAATAVAAGRTLNVNQTSQQAVLNWRSFDVAAGNTVNFNQPNSSAVAINRIYQNSASRIAGALNANGVVYLVNQNGILFANGARVNVGGLLASSLDVTPDAVANGLAAPARSGRAALVQFTDTAGNPLPSAPVRVEQGAELRTTDGGQVLLFAPEVSNQGVIRTPGGQTLLAAGEPVFLATSDDPSFRGLLVEVGRGGTVTNGTAGNAAVTDPTRLAGQIFAERGNITLAGLAVNQLGRVSATTSVRANGSIRLIAREGGGAGAGSLFAGTGGSVVLGERSVTEAVLDDDTTTRTVDVNDQPRSRIEIQGRTIDMLAGARVTATSGRIDVTAREDWRRPLSGSAIPDELVRTPDASRITVARDVVLDASGAQVVLPVDRNIVEVELRGSQLADSPAQRNGTLRGQTVQVDIRRTGTRADGSTWRGTPLANVDGDIATIARDVRERSLLGGEITVASQGTIDVSRGATLDVSGGSIRYTDGFTSTSQLLGADGRLYDIGAADPNRTYLQVVRGYVRESERWGTTEVRASPLAAGGRFEQGYLEGKDAGSISLVAPRMTLDGTLRATTVIGRHQRQLAAAVAAGQAYRPFDQLPLGGLLTLGNPSPALTGDFVINNFVLGARPATNPVGDTLYLDPARLGGDGVTRLRVFANDVARVPESTTLMLPVGGSLEIFASTTLFGGRFDAPSGSVRLTGSAADGSGATAGLVLGPTAMIDVSGRWVNDDSRSAGTAGAQPLPLSGGNVALSGGTVRVAAGSVIDASAGAWLSSTGRFTAGNGGSVSVQATGGTGDVAPVTLDGSLRAYAFARGGSFALSAAEICVTSSDCPSLSGSAVRVAPTLFTSGGFGAFTLTSAARGLLVREGTVVAPVQQNYWLRGDASLLPSGTPLAQLADLVTLPPESRRAANLTLVHRAVLGSSLSPFGAGDFSEAGALVIERGAALIGDARASISLRSNTSMFIDGLVSAPAGNVTATIDSGLPLQEFVPAQGIWVGPNGRIDVRGASIVRNDALGLRTGDVLGGGKVSLQAQRGSIVIDPRAVIDASGSSAELDLPAAAGTRAPRRVASEGGSISLTAAESILLNGAVRVASGAPGEVAGGTLTVRLDPAGRGDPGEPQALFPTRARELRVTNQTAPVVVDFGSSVPVGFQGVAWLPASLLNASGADTLRLESANTRARVAGVDNTLTGLGTVSFDGNLLLASRARLIVDAAQLQGVSGTARLQSAYVALGQSNPLDQATNDAPLGGAARLEVSGEFVELYGNLAASGFAGLVLSSRSDLRLRGVQRSGSLALDGSLSTAADVELRAQQIYPATFTDFTIRAGGGGRTTPALLSVMSVPGERAPVLSAGGHLRLIADRIATSGVLRAPLGELTLQAPEISLAANSLTSATGQGALVPFGTTQGGLDWTYTLPNGETLVFGPGDRSLPAPRVTLDGDTIDFQAGAVVDVSGGGDLQAYEFVPGVGGTRDLLGNLIRPDQYAILPLSGLQYAPYDAAEWRGFGLLPGDALRLPNGAPGLAPGVYALLPARYALLPGAFLVTPATGYTDIRPGERFDRLDGATIVAGARTIAGTTLQADRTSGFAIRRGTSVLQEARYDLSLASQFLAARAAEAGAVGYRLPRDAGSLSLTPRLGLTLAGTLQAAPAAGGRGGSVELAAQRLRVTAPGSAATTGEVSVEAAALERLGSARIVLGARVSASDAGETLDVLADRVTVGEGASLGASEVVLAARDAVTLEAGSSVTSNAAAGDAARAFEVGGNAAILAVSSANSLSLARVGAASTGDLLVANGATVRARGAALLDASGNFSLAGRLDTTGSALWLGAPSIALGSAAPGAAGLVLSAQQVNGLGLRALTLTTPGLLDIAGSSDLALGALTLRAAGVRATQPDANLRIVVSGALALQGSGTVATVAPATGPARLELLAATIDLLGGTFALDNVANARLTTTGDLRIAADGALSAAGDLRLSAARLVSADDVSATVLALGDLELAATGPVAAVAGSAGVGANLELRARNVRHAGRIALPSGSLLIVAEQGDVELLDGSVTDVAGVATDFDGEQRGVSGGLVRIESRSGDMLLAAGSRIDVSGAPGDGTTRGGRLELVAPQGRAELAGTILGSSAEPSRGAEFMLDARQFASLGAIGTLLADGSFSGARDIRLRGPGDLRLAAGERIRAQRVSLVADQGSVSVAGEIDARGPDGGSVRLYALGDVLVSGTIRAQAESSAGSGGRIELGSTAGGVDLRTAATLSVARGSSEDARGGEVQIRVDRLQLERLLDADPDNDRTAIRGTIDGADRIVIEGNRVYTEADGRITANQTLASTGNPWFDDASDFMVRAPAFASALGLGNDARFSIVPGLEIRSAQTGCAAGGCGLELSAPWNLADWRFGDAPGVLTLRAVGDLRIAASLSDGFASPTSFLLAETGPSWSYRLVAGWDGSPADPLAIAPLWLQPATSGSFRIAPGTPSRATASAQAAPVPVLVRTGTGRIDVVAARNFELGNRASVLYTAGRASDLGVRLSNAGGLGGRAYPTGGGDISIRAGNDVIGAATNQLVTEWLWRTGQPVGGIRPTATGWTVNFERFEQNVGALGGGNVLVRAGRDVRLLSASVPSIGRQDGGPGADTSRVTVTGGGRLAVQAARDVVGGSFYVDRGDGLVRAQRDIGAATGTFAPVIALGDSRFEAIAGGGLTLEGVVTPTLLPLSRAQGTTIQTRSYFSTYTDRTRIGLVAAGGTLRLLNSESTSPGTFLGSLGFPAPAPALFSNEQFTLRLYPPTLDALAFAGDLEVLGNLSLFPSPSGDLRLLAGRTVRLGSPDGASELIFSDADPAVLPLQSRPVTSLAVLASVLRSPSSNVTDGFASALPTHSAARRADGRTNPDPVRIVARTGDVVLRSQSPGDASAIIYSAKPVSVFAGRDIRDLGLIAQNLDERSVTSLVAGRDITYSVARSTAGALIASGRELAVYGPGRLQLQAGRDINLQTSRGIASLGNLRNLALPDSGAGISLLAGLGDRAPSWDAFIERYLVNGSAYDAALLLYVQNPGGAPLISKQQALDRLRALNRQQQRGLLEQILFSELRAGGRAAAAAGPTNGDFSRAFAALTTLFPGSNPDLAGGQTNPFRGDIRLFFSRIYTLDGGDISLLAPGGEVNVGLATPPTAFGISKSPSELGIVAQRTGSIASVSFDDFQVNESRTFASDGGDILVWSTRGDIDAGRGAKTAISAPPPQISFDQNGRAIVVFPAALTGSGIQTLATSVERRPGDVDLFAPRGVVNAGDAGIVAGNLTIGATAVLGANNIKVGGVSVGVPVDSGGLAAGLSGVSNVASSASNSATTAVAGTSRRDDRETPLAESALGWLEVFIEGFGEDVCKPNDEECLERQRRRAQP